MCNPAVKVVMFDNHLLFYKSVQFKVIPGTMFSLTPFPEQERKSGVSARCQELYLTLPCPWKRR